MPLPEFELKNKNKTNKLAVQVKAMFLFATEN